MKIDIFNFVGDFKSTTDYGNIKTYYIGDVVYYEGKTYVASRIIEGLSPVLGEKTGWVSLSDKQVLYETANEPFHAKVGDEWFNTTTGIRYKRIENERENVWVEV